MEVWEVDRRPRLPGTVRARLFTRRVVAVRYTLTYSSAALDVCKGQLLGQRFRDLTCPLHGVVLVSCVGWLGMGHTQ